MRRFLPDKPSLWSLAAGLALALSFPRYDLASLAWIALVPLLLVMHERPFRSGFLAGVGFFGLVLYWLNIVMVTYGKMNPALSLAAYFLLVGYLALFFGTATWAACRLREKSGLSPILTLPVFWVALEFLRSYLLTGFPWALLGYSQQAHLPLIQSADLFGVYGLSFLLVLSNAVIAEILRALRSGSAKLPWKGIIALAVLFSLNLGYGLWRLDRHPDARRQTLKVALIQGDIAQGLKWNPAFQKTTVDRYRDLSEASARKEPVHLIIWPESATPFFFQTGGFLKNEVRRIPLQTGAYLLFGSPAFRVVNRAYKYLNSAFLLSPRGQVLGRSDKIHLVPFGEYVPLKTFLPFVNKLVKGIGDFSPGTVDPLPMDGHKIGALICYEGIFPELARAYVNKGADLLVNITNDAWFGNSSAPYQLLAMTRFRAVENRIWLARAANTGISAIIAPSGRITVRSPIFKTLFLDGTVGLGAAPTLYTRFGDVLPVICLILGVFWLVQTRRRLQRNALPS
jgi:apolipoprotein N-acyltransferase